MARKSREGLLAKYTAAKSRGGRHEDSVELLPTNLSSEELQRTVRTETVGVRSEIGFVSRSNRQQPPRDLFGDL